MWLRRFDRELVFPLPNLRARSEILDIHTRRWAKPPPSELRSELADMCVGYCGADLKVCLHIINNAAIGCASNMEVCDGRLSASAICRPSVLRHR